ncbi:AGC family protein kinase [Tritrichomonas foetus]|uniref:AGC family protein kinase n=1 Tax=Tritrichomonas foetus TaxID=1144522 RepID=A0A1J4JND8_9EUKA|nr:AGC family protein kinase [Tritrichomonas foetus]|eukprot:OHS99021.1 AGC family protein kinase [Tritrichomonas foetus]
MSFFIFNSSFRSKMESLASLRGWLRQKTNIFKMDRKRYCIIANNYLSLYKNEKMTETEESFSLSDIVDVHSLCTSSLPSFQISFQKRQPIIFQCLSVPECERWMCALRTPHSTEKVTIDDFLLEKLIGKGMSGKVFLARKKSTGELLAIKAIRKDKLKAHCKEYQIIAERNILMLATHQFITRLFYAFQSPTKFYFALEYVPGGDLRHHLEKEIVFSPFQIKLYLAEIIVALRSIHLLGVIYRDLKPENILIDKEGHIKLADFGLARMVTNENSKNTFCGTYEYLAPEMILEEQQTAAVDYWSLGILAYRLIVGTLPFKNPNPQRLFNMIVKNEPRIPRSIDSVAASFIKALLDKSPTKRLGAIGTDITKHEYFNGLDWAKVAKKQYQPEFQPYIDSEDSVSNFDSIYTEQEPKDSFVELPGNENRCLSPCCECNSSSSFLNSNSSYNSNYTDHDILFDDAIPVNDNGVEFQDENDELVDLPYQTDNTQFLVLKNFSINNEESPLMNSIRSFEDLQELS